MTLIRVGKYLAETFRHRLITSIAELPAGEDLINRMVLDLMYYKELNAKAVLKQYGFDFDDVLVKLKAFSPLYYKLLNLRIQFKDAQVQKDRLPLILQEQQKLCEQIAPINFLQESVFSILVSETNLVNIPIPSSTIRERITRRDITGTENQFRMGQREQYIP